MRRGAEGGRAPGEDTRGESAQDIGPGKVTPTEVLGRPSTGHSSAPGKRTLVDELVARGRIPPDSFESLLDLVRGGEAAAPSAPDQPGVRSGPPQAVQDAIATETGAPLSDAAGWSRRIGAELSGARIVSGPKAAAAAASIGAAAFTVGHRVFLGEGVAPDDEEILRHELTHVAQQRGATVPAASDLKVTSPDDRGSRRRPASRPARTRASRSPPPARR